MKKILFFYFSILLFGSSTAQTLTPTDKMALLEGSVTNFKGKVLGGEMIMLVNEKTAATFTISTNAKGKFQLLVPIGVTYILKYKNFTKDVDYTKMEIPAEKNATYDVEIKIEPPKEFVLENVYFDTGKSTLKPASHKALNDLVEVLKLKPVMEIEIQGHTDNVGDDTENLKLSQDRADAVKKYLASKGIPETRVTAKGYGSTRPMADNATEQGKAKNRRTSLKVLKE
jgi:outer membrane protein OmpA-like peptidoglycan-associated protein